MKTPDQQDCDHEEIVPTLEIVTREVLVEKISKLNKEPNMAIRILFTGDRISCCDEGVIMLAKENIIGFATVAPEGEEQSGQPTIVGLYVVPEYRSKGYGGQILQKAIERCFERGFKNVRMDVMSSNATKIIQKLPKDIQDKLDVRDL